MADSIAQELVNGCNNVQTREFQSMVTKERCSYNNRYCPSCKSQASIYARALNEELEWFKDAYGNDFHPTSPYNKIEKRFSFIESELKILRDARLIK